jgi:hypothetical protein
MNPWLETIGVVIVTLSGFCLGRLFSRLRRPYWVLSYLLSVALIVILVTVRCTNSVAFVPPFCWLTAGRVRFVTLSLAATMGLATPLSRLPYRCEKVLICILMTVVVGWFSVMPFLAPALIKDRLSNLRTRVDAKGICFQSTDYTCGPAAAVTALRNLGFEAHEGEIAVLSHSSPVAGTLPGCLYTALQDRYGAEGLICRYRHFDSVGQLREAGVTLAVVKDAFLSDHCVAVLGVSDQMVIVADPVLGRQLMSHKEFERIWRFSGIALKRDSTRSI